jgi:hypothetical protein
MQDAFIGMLELIWRKPRWIVAAVTSGCILRGIWIAAFYKPVRAKLISDGYRDARRERNEAIFLGERAPLPFTVEDEIIFITDQSTVVRKSVRRWAEPRGDSSLIWYLPHKPERISSTGPVGWLGLGMLALSTRLLLG